MKVSAGKRSEGHGLLRRLQARPRRVLMLLENNPYPHDPRVRLEATTLVGAGHQVTVICPAAWRGHSGRRQPWREVIEGVLVLRYPAPAEGHSLLSYLWEYAYSLLAMLALTIRVCVRPGFDIIHAANPPDTTVLVAAPFKLLGKRFVFDHHDLAPEMYDARYGGQGHRLARWALVWLEKASCRVASQVIATNESYKAVEIARDGVPADRISIVRNGPAPERVRVVEPDEGLAAMAAAGKTIIGYVGVIAQQDGLDYLLRALHRLANDLGRKDFFCVIVGRGSALGDLRAMAASLGLEGHVRFTGYVPDAEMLSCLSAADICVDPDPSNPFNDRCTMIKMMEYMALGKPIVAFDLPEHRVTAQDAAVYARANDELDFARQLAGLMDDPECRARMGRRGRERIEQELAWPHQAQHLLEAYASLEAERGALSKRYA